MEPSTLKPAVFYMNTKPKFNARIMDTAYFEREKEIFPVIDGWILTHPDAGDYDFNYVAYVEGWKSGVLSTPSHFKEYALLHYQLFACYGPLDYKCRLMFVSDCKVNGLSPRWCREYAQKHGFFKHLHELQSLIEKVYLEEPDHYCGWDFGRHCFVDLQGNAFRDWETSYFMPELARK